MSVGWKPAVGRTQHVALCNIWFITIGMKMSGITISVVNKTHRITVKSAENLGIIQTAQG